MPEKKTEEKEETRGGALGTFKDVDTGRLSGVQIGGKSFLGLSPEEVVDITTKESLRQELPIGGQAEAVLEKQRQALQSQGVGLATSVGATPSADILAQLEAGITAGQVSYLDALKSAAPGLIPDALAGAGTGIGLALVAGQAGPQIAAPEEIVTVPTAAIVLGVGNALRGFYSDFVSDIARQKSELIETPIRSLSETKPTMNDIINSQNANPENAVANKEAFDTQDAFLKLEYERLKDLTDDSLNAFLGDTGINQLQEYEVFYQLNGEYDRLIFDMQLALSNPDPSRIRPTAITIDDIRKRIEKELKQ